MKTIVFAHKDFNLPKVFGSEIIILCLGDSKLTGKYQGVSVVNEDSVRDRVYPQFAYSELSGLYFVINHMNISDSEIVNFAHYRRFLTTTPNGISTCSFSKILSSYDLIVPRKLSLFLKDSTSLFSKLKNSSSIEDHYIYNHIKEDWFILITLLKRKYKERHLEIDEFRHQRYLIPFNMMCGKFDLIKNYGNWLFDILEELKKEVVLTGHPYQGRFFGFMGERLFTLYVSLYKLKFKEVDTILIN
jgi:hypothetical protein